MNIQIPLNTVLIVSAYTYWLLPKKDLITGEEIFDENQDLVFSNEKDLEREYSVSFIKSGGELTEQYFCSGEKETQIKEDAKKMNLPHYYVGISGCILT